MSLLEVIILGIVEGLTEFLPISSTGHMILTHWLLNMQETEFLKSFEIAIQLGAILAVMAMYYQRLLAGITIYFKLAVAFLPAAVIGFLAYKTIKGYLFNVYVVSTMLILGGIVLIWVDKILEKRAKEMNDEGKYMSIVGVSYLDAVKIGLIQCISMIPGVSRAAATILGGLYIGFDRKQATEFSFLLAIPTMMAATGYDLLKTKASFSSGEYFQLAVGGAVAFIFAIIAVRGFVTLVSKLGFRYFGYYRIAIGLLFLVLAFVSGYEMKD